MGETVAEHGAWIKGHEKRCEERYSVIQNNIGEIRSDLKTARNLLVSLLIGVVGWLLVQIYNGQKVADSASASAVAANRGRIEALEQHSPPPVTVVQSQEPSH
jgi:hypothetical protein